MSDVGGESVFMHTDIGSILDINTTCQSIPQTLYFIYNKNSILSGRHVSTFIMSSSGFLRKQIQELSIFQCIVGSQMFTDCVIGMQNT